MCITLAIASQICLASVAIVYGGYETIRVLVTTRLRPKPKLAKQAERERRETVPAVHQAPLHIKERSNGPCDHYDTDWTCSEDSEGSKEEEEEEEESSSSNYLSDEVDLGTPTRLFRPKRCAS